MRAPPLGTRGVGACLRDGAPRTRRVTEPESMGICSASVEDYTPWILAAGAVLWALVTAIDIRYERRQIDIFLRRGGARILKFRWKPFLAWMGADSKSKHYEVVFQEHSGRVISAIFTYTARLGVMKTSD